MSEKPMSKAEALRWIRRAREGLRDAEQAIREGNLADLQDALKGALPVYVRCPGCGTEVDTDTADVTEHTDGSGWSIACPGVGCDYPTAADPRFTVDARGRTA